jgi:hypothetical protein
MFGSYGRQREVLMARPEDQIKWHHGNQRKETEGEHLPREGRLAEMILSGCWSVSHIPGGEFSSGDL